MCYGSSIFGYWNCSLLSSCYVFSIIVLVRCVFVLFIVIDLVLCCCCCCSLCLFFVLIIVVARSLCSLSLIMSRRLLVASFWTPRKTSPSVRWNNHFLMLLVILFVHCSWTWSLNSSVLLVLGSVSLLLFSSFVRWLCSWSCYCPCCWCSVVCSWSVLYDWFLVWGLFLVLDVFSKYNETQRTRISWFWFLFSLISFFILSTIKGKQRTRTHNNEHEQYWRTRTPKTQHTQTKRNKNSKSNITCLLHSCCCSLLRVVSWSCCLFLILFSVLDVGIMFYVLLLCLYHWLWLFSVLCHWSGFLLNQLN